MKALLLVSELEDYSIAFANGLSCHAEVILGVPHRRYARLARWVDPAVDLRLLDWPRHRSLANFGFLCSLNRMVSRDQPQVIHLLSNNILWLNLILPLWRATPVVTTVHDVDVHPGDRDTGALPNWATVLAVHQSDAIVVHGEGLRRRAVARFGRPAEDIHILAHPAISRYTALGWCGSTGKDTGRNVAGHPKDFTLLMFGRIFAYKGLELLLRAEAALGNQVPNLRIIVAGRGDNPWKLRHLMGDPGRYEIRNRFVEDQEVADLFESADAVVLPYAEASQSGVLTLAAAFGCPVIATDVGELRNTVERHDIGTIVPHGNAAALAEAILRFARNPELRAHMGRNARRWAEEDIAPETVGADAAAIYRRILDRHKASRVGGKVPRAHGWAEQTGTPHSPQPTDAPAHGSGDKLKDVE